MVVNLRLIIFLMCLSFSSNYLKSQSSDSSKEGGLEGIIVEKYYIADSMDAQDKGSGDILPVGSVTYRIYVDLKPGYELQMVYAYSGHPMEFITTTKFFNSEYPNRSMADDIGLFHASLHTMALDSWATFNTAAKLHAGVLKSNDTDGSILGGVNNNGGSEKIEGGLLTNNDPQMGLPITEADGMISVDTSEFFMPRPIIFNLEMPELHYAENDGKIIIEDGALAVLEGVVGPTPENQILIGQFTTDGDFSFKINLQLIAPYNGIEVFLAENPDEIEFTHPDLIYPKQKKTQ